MDFFTHLVFSALLYSLILGNITYDYVFLAMFFAVLPDLDIFLAPFRKLFKSKYLEHRGGSHSYIVGMVISGIWNAIFAIAFERSFLITWIIGSCFYGLHISMDLLTTTAIPYLYPLSKREKSFYVEKAGSQFTMLNSFILLGLISWVMRTNRDMVLFMSIINFYTFFFITYYAYRIVSKLNISKNLGENQKFFPGVLPFYYYILNKTENELIVERKAHFSKPKIIARSSFELNDLEEKLFKKGSDKLSKDYYMAKWTTFPKFHREDGIFKIKYFFLEPMVRSRAMYMQYDYDLHQKREIRYKQNFGRISMQ